jgi:hypothetical protein
MKDKKERVVAQVLSDVRRNPEVVTSAAVALASSVVLVAYYVSNPSKDAEHYYMRSNRVLLHVMQACYVVIFAALVFNLRFCIAELGRSIGRALNAR